MHKLHIKIQTNNKSDEFKELLLDLASQGYTVTVIPPLDNQPQAEALSHEQVDLINITK